MTDSYGRRSRRKRASGQACLPLALAMGGGILALLIAGAEGLGRLL